MHSTIIKLKNGEELDNGRKYGWLEWDENNKEHKYPKEKFEWETKYEKNED